MSKQRRSPRSAQDRAIDAIYAEIPDIPGCTGACADACGPIAMFRTEWLRVQRAAGRTPRLRPGSLTCPMLSPTGKCTVYTVRPFICRLWGTTPALRCPQGCKPTRWLSTDEVREIWQRLREVTGPAVDGPLGGVEDLWAAIALEVRDQRQSVLNDIRKVVEDERSGA